MATPTAIEPAKRAGEGESVYLDTEIRVKRAEELLCDVRSSTEIVQMLIKEFEVVERTAYTYIKLAYDRLSADTEFDRGVRKAQARAAWRAQYRRCIEKGEYQAANYALDRLCRLDGLFAPQKIEVGATLTVDIQIRSLVGVLDEEGLEALAVLTRQIEAAQARGQLKGVIDADAVEVLDERPVPIPAKGRGRHADRTKTRKPKTKRGAD